MEEFVFEEESTIEATFQMNVVSGEHKDLDGRDLPDQHPMTAITGLESALDNRVDKTSIASQVYGTDSEGNQTTYDVGSFGQVDDVQVGGISVVTNKIAELGTMAGEMASDYSTTSQANELYADKTDTYTKSEVDAALGGKQNNLTSTQLNAVNSGIDSTKVTQIATNTGNISSLQSGKADKATTLSGYGITDVYTKTEVDTALSGKQNSLDTTQMAAVNSGANSTNIGQIATNTNSISSINELIPSEASSSNQLADKEFVNSSISTNTARFIGTFSSVTALEAYSGTVTNNDYAFVVNSVITDNGDDWATFAALDAYNKDLLTNFDYGWVTNGSNFDLYRFDILSQTWNLRVPNTPKASVTLNTAYNRYKATVSGSVVTWEYEYTLNNSSFTASQWAAINSGITSGDVALIATALQPNDNITQLNNDAGYITGITSSDVTTALGYTPYNSTNPAGYTSNVGTVTSVNNTSPDANGNVTITIPDSATWGNISGTLSNQTDLQNALDGKADNSNVVHKTGSETITGFKTFTNKAKITSSTSGAILELESDASNTNFLLKRTGGATCVLESGTNVGLFGTQSSHSLQIRTNYENRMTFDTSGNVTLAKAPSSTSNSNQVATTAWTISKIPTNNNQLTNGAGYITGITSGDVTTALGYTPYDSSNPSGYTSNVGTVTSVNNTQPDANGNVTISTGGTYTEGTGIDITNGVISVTSPTLTNTATGNNSLTIGGTPSTYAGSTNVGMLSNVLSYCTAIGYGANARGSDSIAIGTGSSASGSYSKAIGDGAICSGAYSTQLGYGTNSEANSFYVSTSGSNNWKMLGSDGKIPSGRLSIAISVSSSSTNDETVGAKLFYDTCGDIETLINAL